MRKTQSKKLTCLVLSFLMLLSVLPMTVYAAGEEEEAPAQSGRTTLQEISETLISFSYADYVEQPEYQSASRGKQTVVIKAIDYDAAATTAEVEIVNDYNVSAATGDAGKGKSLKMSDDGKVVWKVNIPETGLYAIKMDYCSVTDKTNSIERGFYINDALPFAEARDLTMKKIWVNAYTKNEETGEERFEVDSNGNELRPVSSVVHEWQEYVFIDPNTFFADPFEFYFEKGENTIALNAVREAVVIQNITIYPYEDLPSYEAYAAGKSPANTSDKYHVVAETPYRTSDFTVYPIYDRKSALTEPQDASKIRLNTIGSDKWQTASQWVEYEIEAPETGLYEVVFRFRQNEQQGMYTSRKLYIDGKIPFEEANYLKFNYNSNFQVAAANDGADTFQFYLEKGKHTLRLEASLGEMGNVVRKVSAIMTSINNDYLSLLKLTGASPDAYRDYGFGRVLPEVVQDLVVQSNNLKEVISYIENMANIKSENSATLDTIARLLRKMGTDEDEIAKNMSQLKTQIGNLGSWISSAKNQPLEIDWIDIQPAGVKYPKAEGNFFQSLWFELKQFFASFFTDYNSLGASVDGKKADRKVEVWVTANRDQAQITRNLMDNDFGPTTGIDASLKLVAGGTLLPSVLAGVGPDVALPGTGADPIQYAIRSAVVAINPEAYEDTTGLKQKEIDKYNEYSQIFSNFHDIEKRFTAAAMIPLTLYGKTYGLPDKQTWNMMFYRTDILANLGLEVPRTWDDLLAAIPVLQFNNMTIGLSQDYQMYMYQLGGHLWADDGMRINLDANLSLEAFETMCNMFTQYSLPISYDFANRFRTGEMPIGIAGYTYYNNIIIFATELAGLWEFGPVPGFLQEDGTINHTAMSGSDALVMMSGVRDVDAAWTFMCWYTDTKFQVDYSNEMVAILGPAAKNPTANQEALEELPWTSREYGQLMKQMDVTIAVTQYPGSYILGRYTSFAFLNAYNNKADPVDSLLGYINIINKEINRKRTEFNLETLEVGQTLASKRLGQAEEAIAKLSDTQKGSAAVSAASAAIASHDIEALRAAADGLRTSDEALAVIAGYLRDAAGALESYLD